MGMLALMLVMGIVVINSFFVNEARTQQENATDAAALAAAEVLTQEALLFADPRIFDMTNCRLPPGSPAAFPSPFCEATQTAIAFGAKNYVGGKSFNIQPKEVFFDIIDIPNRTNVGTLPADPNTDLWKGRVLTLPELRRINSVHVMGKSGCDSKENNLRFPLYGRGRFQAVTRSEAVLDGFVYGFHTHPEGAINIPMLPAALHERSWRAQVESAVDPSFATPTDGPLPYGDFIVHLGAVPHDPEARLPGVYAPILRIGTSNAAEALTQFDAKNPGITPRQYGVYLAASAQKPFALDTKTFRLAAPGSPLVSPDDLALLETNLQGLVNRRLIWPLYAEYDESQGSGRVMITGFVAARIVDVRKTSYHVMVDPNGKGKGKHKGLCHEHPPGFAFGKDKGKGEEKSQDAKGKKKGLNDDQGHNGWNVDPPEGKAYGKKGLCVEFGALQITLRPTMLATSTGMVFVSDWPSGPQHLFRFPNAYIKRIRLVK